MKFKKRYGALFMAFAIAVSSAMPVFAEEAKEPYTTHSLPSTMKIGEAICDLPDYHVYFHNLTPGQTIAASYEATWNPGNLDITFDKQSVCFGQHAGRDPFEDVNENGTVKFWGMWNYNTFFRPGTLTVQPTYQYYNIEDFEGAAPLGDVTAIVKPITIQVEEPVIQTNAPTSIQSGNTFNFTTELTNTALVNKDTAYYLDENNYSKGVNENGNQWGMLNEDEIHKVHEPAYQPSVEILEGKELVSQSNQDYSNTLKSSETLAFTGTGTVKLKVKYNQFITCIDCQAVVDENYRQTGEYYTYNPEKIITIQVTNKAVGVTDSNSGIVISGDNLPNEVTLAVKSNDKQAVKNTETALADISYNEFVAFDITLVDGKGDTVQPNGKVEVSIPLPEKYKGLNNLGVYYINSNAKAEKLESKIENDCITFETDHFSTYALVAEKEEGTNTPSQPEQQKPTTDNPKTGDNHSPMLVVLIFVVSGTTLILLFIRKKKHA